MTFFNMIFEIISAIKKATEPAKRQLAIIRSRELKSMSMRFFIAIAVPVLVLPNSQRVTKENNIADVFMLPSMTR